MLIQEELVQPDIISTSLYNELVNRKTTASTSPALTTLASRCDYVNQSPDLLLNQGVSTTRCTIKLVSMQLDGVLTPLFQPKTTSVSLNSDTGYMTRTYAPNMPQLKRTSESHPRSLEIQKGLLLLFLFLFIALAMYYTGQIQWTALILHQDVRKDSRSDHPPAKGMCDVVFEDSQYYFSVNSRQEDYLPPSPSRQISVTRPGYKAPDTQKTVKSNSEPRTMDLTTRQKRALREIQELERRTVMEKVESASQSDHHAQK